MMSYRLLFCFLIVLEISCILGWFWCSYMQSSAPLVPGPSISRTIPFNNHGATVSLTPFEAKAPWSFLEAGVIIALAGEWVRRRCDFNFRRKELN
jgi:hypothetical protein